ncbi:adenine-specific DNA-methyltransferase [Pontibacter mucosus]|uniref:site-specific DNA-methyltransferase (adenine-specific) n=1 Tax=Pontibacter mucosus TaxID=1649266 RepID=A0A2T5YDR4_9BACT|nr:BsuBI/PstI family type II restriction endonuclease [Pontibacter mucosus]PTX14695.1 adenine-specific DNA-methyltransferase [Pontibacter mucosus]
MEIISKAEALRVEANSKLDPKRKSSLGQFFTPSPICQFMASLFTNIKGEVRLLDPGCGVGSLLAAFTEEAIRREEITSLDIVAYDIENIIKPYLAETLATCSSAVKSKGYEFSSEFIDKDFILSATQLVDNGLFSRKHEGYTHVIMNPPYKKISTSSEHRIAMSQIGIETVNLYTGFVALAIKMLKPGGEIVAIIPRSFCNGPYYHPFRQLLLKETAIKHIHIFDSRNNAFSDNDVLQENVIIHCVKGEVTDDVTITSSPVADFSFDEDHNEYTATDMTVRRVKLGSIVKQNDKQQFIHIAPTNREQAIVDYMAVFNATLDELGVEVSTGPVVDFRLREDLRTDYEDGAAPLLYPVHLNGSVHWPKVSKKPNAIMISQKSKSWLWKHKGYFVLTRRFSSKEEKRRIVASFYDSSLPGEMIGFENKLNVFHTKKAGVDEALAKGLYVYLNSTLLDKYYRQFGGHTQVNATDLKSLHYPSLESLHRMGKQVHTFTLSQNDIDSIIDNEINLMTQNTENNPLNAQSKIEEALEILTALGMPRAQLNERSALTFLALLNLQPTGSWDEIERPMIGVTPIMDWSRDVYGKEYAPNTRETFRRQTLHQFVDAGIALYNPDDPNRAVNSPKACYQIAAELHNTLLAYGTSSWDGKLTEYLKDRETLVQQYAMEREMALIPLQVSDDKEIKLTAGAHSQLIKDIIVEFGPRFAPGAKVVYVGDTGGKTDFFEKDFLAELGVEVDSHGKMPDVVLYYPKEDWVLLIESVTSHGPVDGKRHKELATLFAPIKDKLVYVTAFPDRKTMVKYLNDISWETEVWIADAPTHMIHFNGVRFLGPYKS